MLALLSTGVASASSASCEKLDSGLLRDPPSSALTPELAADSRGRGVVRLAGREQEEEVVDRGRGSWAPAMAAPRVSLPIHGLEVSILSGPPILAWVPTERCLSLSPAYLAADPGDGGMGGGTYLLGPAEGSRSVTLMSWEDCCWCLWARCSCPPCVIDSLAAVEEVWEEFVAIGWLAMEDSALIGSILPGML